MDDAIELAAVEPGHQIGGGHKVGQPRLGEVAPLALGADEVVDRNIDQSFEMLCYVRVSEAIANPHNGLDDFRLAEMKITPLGEGQVELDLEGVLTYNGEPVTLEGIVFNGQRSN